MIFLLSISSVVSPPPQDEVISASDALVCATGRLGASHDQLMAENDKLIGENKKLKDDLRSTKFQVYLCAGAVCGSMLMTLIYIMKWEGAEKMLSFVTSRGR